MSDRPYVVSRSEGPTSLPGPLPRTEVLDGLPAPVVSVVPRSGLSAETPSFRRQRQESEVLLLGPFTEGVVLVYFERNLKHHLSSKGLWADAPSSHRLDRSGSSVATVPDIIVGHNSSTNGTRPVGCLSEGPYLKE